MALRAAAIAAPDYQTGTLDVHTLTSPDPVSVYNACRRAAWLGDNGSGSWSNWATSRKERRENTLLLRSLDDEMSAFEALLLKEQPNLLLIGSMTIAMPGAVACAKLAKEMFGDQICVVLGGRHASETIYFNPQTRNVIHHPGSPLRWMAEGRIEPLFDLVVAGDGEYVIPRVGEIVDLTDRKRKCAAHIQTELGELSQEPGRWIAGWVDSGQVFTLEGKGGLIDYNQLPPPCAMFGVQTSFGETLDNRLTAHVFSDGGRGCVYDCEFCSERCSVTGPPAQMKTSAGRLFRQLSMNWGVQHPLCGLDGGMGYTYHQWGTPAGPFLDAFQAFGEASVNYPLAGQPPPTLEEVEEVREMYNQLCEYSQAKINHHLRAA